MPDVASYVALADVARPFTPTGAVDHLLEHLVADPGQRAAGAVPGVPVFDTVHRIDESGVATGIIDRDVLRRAQAPQLFCRVCLDHAHAQAQRWGSRATDDAGLVAACGGRVLVTPGSSLNIKITDESDLRLAGALLAAGLVGGADRRP
jgi:2-C-methyl-D-erythritol 4-phosphate cytidylyltransferase